MIMKIDKKKILNTILLTLLFIISSIVICVLFEEGLWEQNRNITSDTDQILFELIGKGWSQGKLPYLYYFDHKGPMLFLFYAISYSLTNNNIGLIVMATILFTITIWLLYKIIKDFEKFEDKKTNNILSIIAAITVTALTIIIQSQIFEGWISLGLTVTCVATPYLLGCVRILQKIIKQPDLWNKKYLHAIYGILCMCVMLHRVSDAFFVILAYIVIWFSKFKNTKIKNNIIYAAHTLLYGLIPLIIWSIYFTIKGCFAEFMDATFFANFTYMQNADHNAQIKDVIFIGVILVTILTINLINVRYIKDKTNKIVYISLIILSYIHLAILTFVTPMYRHYLSIFVINICIILAIKYKYKKLKDKQILLNILIILILIPTILAYTWTIRTAQRKIADEFNEPVYARMENIVTDIVNNYDTYCLFDTWLDVYALKIDNKAPEMRYNIYQRWWAKAELVNKEKIAEDIRQHKPQIIVASEPDESNYTEDVRDNEEIKNNYHKIKYINILSDPKIKQHLEYEEKKYGTLPKHPYFQACKLTFYERNDYVKN